MAYSNENLILWLDVALIQRKRAAQAAQLKYGTNHAVTTELSKEAIDIQQLISDLRSGAQLDLRPPQKK